MTYDVSLVQLGHHLLDDGLDVHLLLLVVFEHLKKDQIFLNHWIKFLTTGRIEDVLHNIS